MNVLLTLLQIVQILSAIAMIVLILMQHGKGADAGAAFGGGGAGSASLFGATGGANFLSRSTAVLAAVFLATTLGLAYFGNLRSTSPSTGSVLETVAPTQPTGVQQIPGATDAPAGGSAPAAAPTPVAPAAGDAKGAAQIPGQ